MDVYLSATQAAAFLGVAKPTLYAYVSRGLVRSQAGADSRARTYNRLDLEQLRARKRIRNRPQAEVAAALQWGAPLLDSSLTLITNDCLYYRGLNALELALSRTFWEVACWFWSGNWEVRPLPADPDLRRRKRTSDPFHLQQSWLIERSHSDPLGYQLAMPFAGELGTSIVRQFLAFLTGAAHPSIEQVALELAACWCQQAGRAERVLNAVLILTLDHEINVSSFTSRVVASAGSNLYEVVNAAMCAFSGARHGRASERAEQFIRELEEAESALAVIHGRLRSGEEIPGFGHPLYPGGDPRARLILATLSGRFPGGVRQDSNQDQGFRTGASKSGQCRHGAGGRAQSPGTSGAFRIPPVRVRKNRRLDRARTGAAAKRITYSAAGSIRWCHARRVSG